MFAIGRSPNTAGLGLEDVGVKLSGNGAVAVEGAWQTSVPSIYAVGDVTDRVNLTPVAIREGHAFADTVFGNQVLDRRLRNDPHRRLRDAGTWNSRLFRARSPCAIR